MMKCCNVYHFDKISQIGVALVDFLPFAQVTWVRLPILTPSGLPWLLKIRVGGDT